jgi:hypothetical protein
VARLPGESKISDNAHRLTEFIGMSERILMLPEGKLATEFIRANRDAVRRGGAIVKCVERGSL